MPVDASTQHNEATTEIARPVTTKPRGICKYYNTARGCYAGDRCKFLHGENERMSPFDKNKPCKFYAAGFCKRGDRCWFVHARPGTSGKRAASQFDEDDENLCSICYDKPATYGLLVGCSHIFCITCIKNWRGSEGKSEDIIQAGTTKTCPMCRTASRFVIPSTFYYAEQDPRKAQTIQNYKASMARIKCKYFERSLLSRRRKCPFGNECFFKHENADGTPYVFEHGAGHYMEVSE
ncbi:hypothetical protein BD413DRAFT_480264 [Trametes elegans]|nr:hypothetical protein BD413DRAFT_480264 [Trametes elegans]